MATHRHDANLREGIEQKYMTVHDHDQQSSTITNVTDKMPQAIRVTHEHVQGGGATRVAVDLEDATSDT